MGENGRRILILSENFGSGHTKAAKAIKEGINYFHPDWSINIIEVGAYLHPKINKLITTLYSKMLNHSPILWKYIYYKNKDRMTKPQFNFILHRFVYANLLKLILEYKPDVIITTHPFPGLIVSRLKRMGLNIPLHTVITDYGIHGFWVSKEVDYYYVSSQKIRDILFNFGIENRQIFVTGIPTHPKFWRKNDRTEIRSKLGLKNIPTILLMGGGDGLGVNSGILDVLYKYCEKVQIIIVTGHNKKLYKRINKNLSNYADNIHVYGFVDNIDELMDAADLLITKPGGITSSEALNKGLPMILLKAIPGQEEDNADFIQEHNFGVSLENLATLENYLVNLIGQSEIFLKDFNLKNNFSGINVIEKIISNTIKKGA